MVSKVKSLFFAHLTHFLSGVVIGLILFAVLFSEDTSYSATIPPVEQNIKYVHNTEALEKIKKIRILCLLNTNPAHHYRALHIKQTWGRNCDKLIFASTLTDMNLGTIGFNVTDSHDYIWTKQTMMMQYVYKNYWHHYDWFYKADDDTFAILENLRYTLAGYSTNDPIFIGYKFHTPIHRWGYCSGGGGYAMSKTTLRTFVEKVLTNETLCPQIHQYRKLSEDWFVAMCLARVNVFPVDSRDWVKRERFLMLDPERHLFSKSNKWYWRRQYYLNDEGLDCCSNHTVAFHYIYPTKMYAMFYLSYHLKPYGIQHRYPPSPQMHNANTMLKTLEMERMNTSYRGFNASYYAKIYKKLITEV